MRANAAGYGSDFFAPSPDPYSGIDKCKHCHFQEFAFQPITAGGSSNQRGAAKCTKTMHPSSPDITLELFQQFRSPRRGNGNPETTTNPIWIRAIEDRLSGWSLNKFFRGPPSKEAGPCWSFQRFGRTETELPDGRIVKIGGEYEDWYDADFYIYNDVIVTDAEGHIQVFGYTDEAFPPTDFHTANLVDDRIFVIGNLSSPSFRKNKAQVIVLETNRYSFAHFNTTGEAPPWLHKHTAELMDNGTAILVRGGLFIDERWPSAVENIDDWRLDLGNGCWDRLTRRSWPRFLFVRADGGYNHLYWLRRLNLERGRAGHNDTYSEKFLSDLGPSPRLDLLEMLYTPDLPHSRPTTGDNDRNIYSISVDGVIVRYVESSYDIALTIQGDLPEEIAAFLHSDLMRKLSKIENADIRCIPIVV